MVNKDKMKLLHANADSNLFCKLYIASQARKGNVFEFFNHENNKNPPSISEFGRPRKPTGADDILRCLSNEKTRSMTVCPTSVEVKATALIINASSIAQDLIPKTYMTVKDYSDYIFNEFIVTKCSKYSRIDVVFEINQENSLKEMTREGVAQPKFLNLIDNDTKLFKTKQSFTNFLNTNSKIQFFSLLKLNLTESETLKATKKIISTGDSVVFSNEEVAHTSALSISREDTNARLLLHVENAIRNGHRNIVISCNDSSSVIVAIYSFKYLLPSITELWVELIHDGKKNLIAIHDLYQMHNEKSDLLPFFHALTGYDPTTSAFHGIGKKHAWNVWMKFRDVDPAMTELIRNNTPNLCEKSMNILERFIMSMYISTAKPKVKSLADCKFKSLSDCRRVLFVVENKTIDKVPPTRNTLEQHVKRALFQANVWTQCLEKRSIVLMPTDWGWTNDNMGKYVPTWTTIPVLAEHCREIISCGCKAKCTKCSCVKEGMKCTQLCTCTCAIV